MRTLTASEIIELSGAVRAVVFLSVNWSIPARDASRLALQLETRWRERHPESIVPFVQIDLSEQTGPVWDATGCWLCDQWLADPEMLMFCGAGPLLWIVEGRVRLRILAPCAVPLDTLYEQTQLLFGMPADRTCET